MISRSHWLDLLRAGGLAQLSAASAPMDARTSRVWLLRLSPDDKISNGLWPLLADDERARAGAFRVTTARSQFIQVRGVLRLLLGRCLGLAAADVDLRYGRFGKPALAGRRDWHFNVAHSGQYALLCVAKGREVGVDIERCRMSPELGAMSGMVFSEAEIAHNRTLPPDTRVSRFFAVWTAKEAVAKAVGQGLRLDFSSMDIGWPLGRAGERPRIVTAGAFGRCRLAWLPAPPGYTAALALRQDD